MMKPLTSVRVGKKLIRYGASYQSVYRCGYCGDHFVSSTSQLPKSCGCRGKKSSIILMNDDGTRDRSEGAVQVGAPFRTSGKLAQCVARCMRCQSYFVTGMHKLRSNGTKSCGCLAREASVRNFAKASLRNIRHGHYGTPEYFALQGAKSRCHTNPHKDYGLRGIKVCDRWLNGEGGLVGIECFLEDMGKRPEGMTLDRINPDGNYEPSNCRWATPRQQMNNRRCTKLYSYEGYSFAAMEWFRLKDSGHAAGSMTRRLRSWTVKDAIEVPFGVKRSEVTPAQRLLERSRVLRNILKQHCGV